FTVSGTNAFDEEGTYAVVVRISDSGGAAAVASTTAAVADAPLSARGHAVSAVEGAPFSGVVAAFTDADPAGALGDYTATIDWGDGATSTGAIAYDSAAGAFTVTGTHTYDEEGTYAVDVRVDDAGGASALAGGAASVADAPLSAVGL